jgi:hypothetical protein
MHGATIKITIKIKIKLKGGVNFCPHPPKN